MPSSSVSSPKYDANKAYPLSRNNANNANLDPHRLCYHRFQDATGTSHEIFVPAGKEREIIELEDNEDWDALLAKFPPFSDRPPVFTVQPNCVEVPMGLNSSMKRFYIPEDQAKVDRVCELVIAEDYRTLEREFELWGLLDDQQPAHSHVQRHEEWMRGVERCAYARDEEEEARKKKQQQQQAE